MMSAQKYYPEQCALSDTNYAVIYDLHSHTTADTGFQKHWCTVQSRCASAPGDHQQTSLAAIAQQEEIHSGLALNLIPGYGNFHSLENQIHIVGLDIIVLIRY